MRPLAGAAAQNPFTIPARTSPDEQQRLLSFQAGGPLAKGQPFPQPHRRQPPAGAGGSRDYPELLCLCGGPCIVPTCRTGKNPHRDFYRCPKVQGQGACDQFPWCYSAASPCGGNERINSLVPEEQKDPQAHEAKAAEVNNVIISRGTVVPTSRTQPPRSMREERENNYVDPLIRRINFEEDSPSKPVEGLKSISSRRVNDRENKTTVQVKWYESPANVNEAEKTFGINDPKNYGDEGLPNYSLVAEELDDYELCAVLEAIESKSSYNKAEDPKTYAAGAIKDSNILEESMVPTSPLPLPLQADHASHAGLLSSPMKCYRCGREGHWIKDFTNLPLLQVRPVCPLEEQRILV